MSGNMPTIVQLQTTVLLISLELNCSTFMLVSTSKNAETDIFFVLIEKNQMISQVGTLGCLEKKFTWEMVRGRRMYLMNSSGNFILPIPFLTSMIQDNLQGIISKEKYECHSFSFFFLMCTLLF